MFERFTQTARAAVVSAQASARELGHREIGVEHLLLGLLRTEGVASRVLIGLGVQDATVRAQVASFGSPDRDALKSIGIDLDEVRRRAESTFGPGALDRSRRQRTGLFGHRSDGGGHLPFTQEAKSAMELSLREAVGRRDTYIGSEHLLLGLVATKQHSVLDLLRRVGLSVDASSVRNAVLEELRRSA